MAQTGVLDYQRYLNTLQTLNDLGQTFPSNKQTYNFSVIGGTTSSWTATISWKTLVLDKVSFSSKATGYVPNVDNSQVIGYVDGGTSTQYSTGVISIPANMYTGPILPGGDYHVPLTVVQLEWFDGVTTYAQQIGFIQNWEPGVEIGDPTQGFDYHPVYSLPSTLTLTGQAGLLYGDNLTLTATSDIPLDLTGLKCRFYKKTGDVLLGLGTFSGSSANFTITTIDNFPIGTYEVYAVSPPFKNFLTARSNDFTITVADGIPLIVTTSTFTPSKAYYYIGETVTYNLGVIPDPAFTATGVAIANTVTIKLIDIFSPFTETPVATTNFVNGQTSNPFIIENHMVDLTRADPRTTYSVTTSSYNTTTYTATLFVSNTETVVSSWDSQFVGRYAGGSTSTVITVAGTATVTIEGQAFPIIITQDSDNTYLNDEFNITVSTPNVAYYNNITIYASKGATTLTLYSTNSSGTSSFVAPINATFASTGTWTIYAAYPGDFGSSIVNVNFPSTSNSLSHFIRDGNTLLPVPKLFFNRTSNNDILQVTATTSTTLTNVVSFYEGSTLLGTATWVRNTGSIYVTIPGTGVTAKQGGFARNFEVLKNTPTYTARSYTGTIKSYVLPFPFANFTERAEWNESDTLNPGGLGQFAFQWDQVTWQINRTNPMSSYGWASPPGELTVNSDYPQFGYPGAINGTYPKTSTDNYWDANPNMTVTNQLYAGAPYPKHPNRYTLFKYYDGSNYNLNAITGTDITAISDPIQFGGWSVTQDERGAGYSTPFRYDTIGDTRGYNVIGIETTSTDRPLLGAPEGFAHRLYFQGSTSTRYIDLVEFIGTASWQTAALDPEVFPGLPTTSTISVWLYKFTPTIPAPSSRYFKSNYPLFLCQYFSGAYSNASGFRGSFGPYQPTLNQNWLNYGKMQWVSTNTSSAQANDTAAFYNDWFNAFTNPLGTSIEYNRAGYFENSTQTATLVLPLNTISTLSNVRAVWTGTQNLPRIYGKYFGFDIPVSDTPTSVTLSSYSTGNQRTPGAQPNPPSDTIELWQTSTQITKVQGNLNPVRLTAEVKFVNSSTLNSTSTISGDVTFFNVITNQVYGTSTVITRRVSIPNNMYIGPITTSSTVTNFAVLDVHAFKFNSGGLNQVAARFEGTNRLAKSTSTTLPLSVTGPTYGYGLAIEESGNTGDNPKLIQTLTYTNTDKDVYINGVITVWFPWRELSGGGSSGSTIAFAEAKTYYSIDNGVTLHDLNLTRWSPNNSYPYHGLNAFFAYTYYYGPNYSGNRNTVGNRLNLEFTKVVSSAGPGVWQSGTIKIYARAGTGSGLSNQGPNVWPWTGYIEFTQGAYLEYR